MKFLVNIFEEIRKKTGLKPHYIETAVAAAILVATAIISGKGIVEWVGVLGVILTFEYQVLSTYLREHAEARKQKGHEKKSDTIYMEIQVLFYLKEVIWTAYFLALGAYSAIAGTIIFIIYGAWRKLYRQEIPLSDDDII